MDKSKSPYLLKTIINTFMVFSIIAFFLNINRFFELLTPSLVDFSEQNSANEITWTGDVFLEKGAYYLTAGRPQGSCNLYDSGNLIDSNEGSAESSRSSLFVGSIIAAKEDGHHSFALKCTKTVGSPIRLIHSIHLSSYRMGIALHLARLVTDILLPYLAIIFSIMVLVFLSKSENYFLPKEALLSGAFTALYLTSLSNLPHLVLNNKDALFFHSILKVLFIYSTLIWLFRSHRTRKFVTITHGVALLSLVLFNFGNYNYFYPTYNSYIHLIPVIILISMAITKSSAPNLFLSILPVGLSILIFTVIDCISLDLGKGGFSAVGTSISIFGLLIHSYLKTESARSLSRKVVSIITSKQLEKSTATESIRQIAMILSESLKLSKWSVYLDSYSLGSAPKPGRELRRITSSDFDAQALNTTVSLEETSDKGIVMSEALQTRKAIVRQSTSGEIYLVIPIGKVGCINLTSDSKSKFSLDFIQTFVEASYQQINAIVLNILKFDSAAHFSVTLLKEELGVGTHEMEFGAIFADAVGYTQNVKSTKSFIEFFEREYIPSLLRNLDKKVILKDLFGDELYLIVLPNQISHFEGKGIYANTVEMVQKIVEFSLGQGADMCISSGYKPIEFKIGANAGFGQIVVSHTNVALSGPVIEAKRCQGRALASQPFITDILFDNTPEELKVNPIKEAYAAKKEILSGYRLSRNSRVA